MKKYTWIAEGINMLDSYIIDTYGNDVDEAYEKAINQFEDEVAYDEVFPYDRKTHKKIKWCDIQQTIISLKED